MNETNASEPSDALTEIRVCLHESEAYKRWNQSSRNVLTSSSCKRKTVANACASQSEV